MHHMRQSGAVLQSFSSLQPLLYFSWVSRFECLRFASGNFGCCLAQRDIRHLFFLLRFKLISSFPGIAICWMIWLQICWGARVQVMRTCRVTYVFEVGKHICRKGSVYHLISLESETFCFLQVFKVSPRQYTWCFIFVCYPIEPAQVKAYWHYKFMLM